MLGTAVPVIVSQPKLSENRHRGGSNSLGYQYSGSNNINEVAWYYYNSRVDPIKGKKPNELGIYDMA
jgi:hypothetical protein